MYDRDQLSILLGVCIVPQVIAELKKSRGDTEECLIREFYASQLFDKLQNPSTGIWHLSPKILSGMFLEERQGHEVNFPEEQS